MAKQDWHLTTAQFSAFLDKQLSSDEQVQVEAHLHNCQQCQQQLADLRQTVAFLHAIPQPQLPRSFVLPAGSAISAVPTPTSQTTPPLHPAPVMPLRQRRVWPSYVRNTLQVVSTLAAVLGIVFLLSSVMTAIPYQGASNSVSSSASTTSPTTPTQAPTRGSQSSIAPSLTTPHVVATPQVNKGTTYPPIHAAQTSIFNPTTASGRAIIGAILLLLGMFGFVLLVCQRKHVRAGS